ncbi:MAG: endonuclease/exonuclease/phosphatase family protein [Rhizobiaceae bacterium]
MRLLNRFVLFCGALILAALILGHLNFLHPAFDSLAHFRLHLAAFGVLSALVLAGFRNPLGAAALGVTSLLSFAITVWPVLATSKAAAPTEAGPVYRLLQANLRFDNATPEALLRLIGQTKPDIVTVQEVSAQWEPKLAAIKGTYPHQLICPGTNRVGGVAILSRRPFMPSGLAICAHKGAFAAQAVDFNGGQVLIASIHLEWPWPHLQPLQLDLMKATFEKLRTAGAPVLIGGDMNATPWSAAVALVSRQTGTRTLPRARGTWLLGRFPESWTTYLGLPIDNILASPGVALLSAETGAQFGSDHRPLLVEFMVSPHTLETPDVTAPS